MKQVTRSLIALGGLAAAGGAMVFFASLDKDAKTERSAELVNLQDREVVAVEVTDRGQSFRVARQKDRWEVTDARVVAADPAKVKELVDGFIRLRVAERLTAAQAPTDEEMGLSSPGAVQVVVTTRQTERPHTLTVGKINSFNKQTYARYAVGDDAAQIVLLAGSARAPLTKPPSHYYDRRPLGALPEQVQRISVIPAEPSESRVAYTLQREYEGEVQRWRIVEPDAGEADPFIVRQLFEGVSGAPIAAFPSFDGASDPARWGLSPRQFTVKAQLKLHADDKSELTERVLIVGAIANPEEASPMNQRVRLARGDQPWVGESSAVLLHALPRRLDELKTKRVADVEPADVTRVELQLKRAGPITLERTGAKPPAWRVLAPEPADADAGAVNMMLLSVGKLSGVSREAEGQAARAPQMLARTGLAKDADVVRFLGDNDKLLAELRIGNDDGEQVFVTRTGSDVIMRVPSQRLDVLPKDVAELFPVKKK